MSAIGGYFSLELRQGEHYHKGAVALNSARNGFEYILLARKYRKAYIPYYTCEVMLQPLHKHGVAFEFYHIDESLEPIELPSLKQDEAFLYTNYYALKQNCIKRLAERYGARLIVDNAQAFYAPHLDGIDTIYSARKFFGVPDGGFLYTDCLLSRNFVKDVSYDRCNHLLKRIDMGAEAAYDDFRTNDLALDNVEIRRMSDLTDAILRSVDYGHVRKCRVDNFQVLHDNLAATNKLKITPISDADNTCPMVYPYWTDDDSLRKRLIGNRIFVATYWPNVMQWCTREMTEYNLAHRVIPIPIDQRYKKDDMEFIINAINN